MVEMRQRIDRADAEKEIEETIQVMFSYRRVVCYILYILTLCTFDRGCVILQRTERESFNHTFNVILYHFIHLYVHTYTSINILIVLIVLTVLYSSHKISTRRVQSLHPHRPHLMSSIHLSGLCRFTSLFLSFLSDSSLLSIVYIYILYITSPSFHPPCD